MLSCSTTLQLTMKIILPIQYMRGRFLEFFLLLSNHLIEIKDNNYSTFIIIKCLQQTYESNCSWSVLQSPKHECEHILSRYFINVLSFQIQNIIKMSTGAYPSVLHFCTCFVGLPTMILHHNVSRRWIHVHITSSQLTKTRRGPRSAATVVIDMLINDMILNVHSYKMEK